MIKIHSVLPGTEVTLEDGNGNVYTTIGENNSYDESVFSTLSVVRGAVMFTDADGFFGIVAAGAQPQLFDVWPQAATPVAPAPAPAPEVTPEPAPEEPAA